MGTVTQPDQMAFFYFQEPKQSRKIIHMEIKRQLLLAGGAFALRSAIIKDDLEMIFKIKGLGSPLKSCLHSSIEKNNPGLCHFKAVRFVKNSAIIVRGKVRHAIYIISFDFYRLMNLKLQKAPSHDRSF